MNTDDSKYIIKHTGHYMYHFNSYILLARFIYVLHMILTISSTQFP